MLIRAPLELGAYLRDVRTKRGLDQGSLAREVGVSRQWIVAIEKGKPRAPIGLVFRTLNALGITLTLSDPVGVGARSKKVRSKKDVDLVHQILTRLQDKKS